jgi:ribosomal protein L4
MPQIDVFDRTGATVGSVELSDELFAAPVNAAVLHQVVTAQLAGRRTGTHDTKTRGEIRGGGKKPYRQKGTGRARQGTVSASSSSPRAATRSSSCRRATCRRSRSSWPTRSTWSTSSTRTPS